MKLRINNKDMAALFDKAKWTFSLTAEELLYLKSTLNEIETCSWQEDSSLGIHNGIAAFGLCTKPTEDNIALIEKFINTEAFCDSITATALKVLCSNSYWNLAAKYEDLLCKFINIDDETYEETIRTAISCMGSYCHTTKNKTYISQLLSLFNKALSTYCDDGFQTPDIETLYNSLESVIWGNEYPKGRRVTFGDMKIPDDISEEVIKRIQSMIQ
uniref:Uncharacterized protein n=1 Tax=Prevotella sp. GTC17262 TaxID=3236797 RepID=A0AB33JML3_9BACT